MRTLFIAAGKVFGLLQIYTGLACIASVLPLIRVFCEPSSSTATTVKTFYGSSFTLTAISISSMLILTFGTAWILLFRAEWLADKLKLPEEGDDVPFGTAALLGTGVRLIGIFFVVQSAPQLLSNLCRTISSAQQLISLRNSMGSDVLGRALFEGIWSGLVAEAVKLTLALLLVFKTDSVLNLLQRKET